MASRRKRNAAISRATTTRMATIPAISPAEGPPEPEPPPPVFPADTVLPDALAIRCTAWIADWARPFEPPVVLGLRPASALAGPALASPKPAGITTSSDWGLWNEISLSRNVAYVCG